MAQKLLDIIDSEKLQSFDGRGVLSIFGDTIIVRRDWFLQILGVS